MLTENCAYGTRDAPIEISDDESTPVNVNFATIGL